MAKKSRRNAGNPPPPPAETAGFDAEAKLYTQCPLCKTRYRITFIQIKRGRGQAHCLNCLQDFDALEYLATRPDLAETGEPKSAHLPRLGKLEEIKPILQPGSIPINALEPAEADPSQNTPKPSPVWALASGILLLILPWQFWNLDGHPISQNSKLRPWLEQACLRLACKLPPYHAPTEIRIISHDLVIDEAAATLNLQIILINEATFAQDYPIIQINLESQAGETLSAGVFEPKQYLPKSAENRLESGQLREINLRIARPQSEFEGLGISLH